MYDLSYQICRPNIAFNYSSLVYALNSGKMQTLNKWAMVYRSVILLSISLTLLLLSTVLGLRGLNAG